MNIVDNEVYILNGGLRSAFGGRSRTIIPIHDLPNKTTGLVYTIQAYKNGENVEQKISLALALAATVSMNAPLAKIFENVEIPASTQTIDMFLLPNINDAQLFLNKTETWNHYHDYEKLGCMNCKVAANWPLNGKSNAYIGIRNPSGLDAIKVVINVVALVSE